jgi:hypothetical protein
MNHGTNYTTQMIFTKAKEVKPNLSVRQLVEAAIKTGKAP